MLNRLIESAGELVLGRNQINNLMAMRMLDQKVVKEALMEAKDSGDLDRLEQVLSNRILDITESTGLMQSFSQISSELQEQIMNTRLQFVRTVFSNFPRVIRDIAKKLGKEIELELSGEDVELDKTIIDALGDPMTHLVRNSCDHGVETPEAREEKGKPRIGRVQLKAYHEGGQVFIDIIDDGAGMNADFLKAKAMEKGILSEAEAEAEADHMSDRDAFKLIFRPDFSTAAQVTDVSGRGVGMDVVRSNIEKIGGSIEIESERDKGSTISLRLPLTLAIISALLVEEQGRYFALPQVSVQELVRLRHADVSDRIATANGLPVLKLRGQLLPLIKLSDILGGDKTVEAGSEIIVDRRVKIQDRRSDEIFDKDASKENRPSKERRKGNLYIVILSIGVHRYGLIVDRLHDTQELVVKPLSSYLNDSKIYSGATILGDGHVAMILDAAGIANDRELRFGENQVNLEEEVVRSYNSTKEAQTMLCFEAGSREHFAVNLSMVSRIEDVSCDRIEKLGDRYYLKYDNHSIPVVYLHEHLPIHIEDTEWEPQYLLIPRLVSHPVGILISKTQDVFETDKEPDRGGFQHKGIHGAFTRDGTLTLFLDLYSIFEIVEPEKYNFNDLQTEMSGKKVLLAEDTALFRTVMGDFLKDCGFEVTEAVDGQQAWETLNSERFDALVTDIVMPNMDGMELTRHVRDSETLSKLPIIAVTSLYQEEDRKKIMESGVDEYMRKLDKEQMLKTLNRILGVRELV